MTGRERERPAGKGRGVDRILQRHAGTEDHSSGRVLHGSVEPAPFGHTRERRCSLDQLRTLHLGLVDLGVPDDHDERVLVVSNILGRAISSTGHLTRDEADLVIEMLLIELDGRTA